jgi:phosphatidylserine/phosphatidylglycerophosphate/cardiolipin synthase-like enzyme
MAAPLARRVAVLIDGEAYFKRLASCLRKATRSILIVGWDFDASITLEPGPNPEPLGSLLRSLVEARPDLNVRVLVWSAAIVHAPGASLPLIVGAGWEKHSRIRVQLDTHHPPYAAHHQKIVCIDDDVAFVGGMDLTVSRWDRTAHRATEQGRINPDGNGYGPVHDVHAVIQGPAARTLADVARDRWFKATGERLLAVEPGCDLWPDGLAAQFENTRVGISRTIPQWRAEHCVRESATMVIDAIRSARRSIYIEAQYFTSPRVGKALREKLVHPNGPEVVVVVGMSARGRLEHYVMGKNRDRLVQQLRRDDRHGRFRIYHPVVPCGDATAPLKVHSKLMIIDDILLRVGSSNLNNRSEGLDTECDIAIEAVAPAARRAVERIRDELLGEHLGVSGEEVAVAVARQRSLIAGIEELNCGQRSLRELPQTARRSPPRPVLGTWLLDPSQPLFCSAWPRLRKLLSGGRDRPTA